jgi:hypothetical protein
MAAKQDPNWKAIGLPVAAPSAPWTSSEAYDGSQGMYSEEGGLASDGAPGIPDAFGKMQTRNDPSPFVIKGNTK